MISQQMPRLDLGNRFGMGETLEAFALTYLAHYNALDLESRMVISYLRAWAFDQIIMVPRVPGGRPSFVIALWKGTGAWKVVVAIEGATSRAQVASFTSALDVATPSPPIGIVEKNFKDRSEEVNTAMFAQAAFDEAIARRNTQFTFAGFSLGAAVAELLAFRFKNQDARRIVKCEKFAAPRVGNAVWNEGRNPAVNVNNMLLNNDPIAAFPQFGIRSAFDSFPNPLGRVVWFNADPVVDRRSRLGDIIGGYVNGWTRPIPRLALQLVQTMDADNPWFDHDRQQYRLMLNNYCAATADHLTYRFNYLEHDDENSWQQNFRPGRLFDGTLMLLLVPPPADRTPAQSDLPVETIRPRAVQEVVPQNDQPWNDEGDFGVTPPSVSVSQRLQRIRTR